MTTYSLRVIGIDPGTATTGWAILEEKEGEIKAVAYGHISMEKTESEEARLLEICADLQKIIQKHRPTEAAIEKIFFFKNQEDRDPGVPSQRRDIVNTETKQSQNV